MTVRLFVLGSFVTTLIAWGVWALIINWIDPIEAGVIGFALFFLLLFLAVASTTALVGYGLRRLLFASRFAVRHVQPSLRQGIWLGVFFDLLLFLQLHRLLRWWMILIIVFVFVFLELLFLSYDAGTRKSSQAT